MIRGGIIMYDKVVIVKLDKLDLKKDSTVYLEPISDEQVGSRLTDLEAIRKRSKAIRNSSNRFTYFGGDQINAITPQDKRWNKDTEALDDPEEQRALWQDIHQKLFDAHKKQTTKQVWTTPTTSDMTTTYTHEGINEKIWALMWGNHEYKINFLTKELLKRQYCVPNKIHFFGAKGMIGLRVMWKNEILHEWTLALMHGSGGGTVENMWRLQKQNQVADWYGCGHLHQKMFKEELYNRFDFGLGRWVTSKVVLVNVGSFQKVMMPDVDGYMDRKNGIVGTEIGTTTTGFNAYEGKMSCHL